MKRGRAVTFHGAFGSKADARRKEHRVSGGYIRPTTIGGHRRFLVLSQNPSGPYRLAPYHVAQSRLAASEADSALRYFRRTGRWPMGLSTRAMRYIRSRYDMRQNPAEHRPRVTIRRHTGRTFTLGRQSPWKGRVRRVNPHHRTRSGGGSGLLWLGLIAGGLWLLSRRNAEAALPAVETLPGTIIQGPSGPETATTTPNGSGPGLIYG